MRKKNGELFVTPLTATPNSSPRAYRNRRDRDIEAGDDPSTPTKGSYGRAVHMDDV
jgi:hypothetical protein